ncbi:MAG: PHP domain-containing protein, partial [Deltaproteobacteria bacterium]
MIDLHTHSTASDGSFTPTELINYAKNKGIEVLALTDHDTISGISEAIEAAEKAGIDFVPGVEISALWLIGTMHILGYY